MNTPISGSTADGEAFVIGGAEIFRQTLPLCDRIYITEIQADFEGDILFPEFNLEEWIEMSRDQHSWDEGTLDYHFVVLDRKNQKRKRGSLWVPAVLNFNISQILLPQDYKTTTSGSGKPLKLLA